jgi:2-aminoadipate transaminase
VCARLLSAKSSKSRITRRLSLSPAAWQYSTTEGYLPLREWIAERYQSRFGLSISPEEILITTGSQQGLDLIGKVFINPGDKVLIERPGYLGAIQSFSLYQPNFFGIESSCEGLDPSSLERALQGNPAKLLYTVPNFQNPSGATYSEKVRRAVADAAAKYGFVLIEDDPYGELRYNGQPLPPLRLLHAPTIMLGSFSKIVAPGLRLGWLAASREVIRNLVVAKQASDLHTDAFAQRIIHGFLRSYDLETHLARIRTAYGSRCSAMVRAFRTHLPATSRCNDPDGGMFLWATLPETMSSRVLFDKAILRQVAFVPGTAFYVDDGGSNSMRLNFTNSNEPQIDEGMRRLASALAKMT